MSSAELTYLFPYLFSLLLSLAILFFVWSKKNSQGIFAFGWYVIGQTLWIAGFILELTSSSLEDKVLWDGFQWLSGHLILLAMPVFAAP